MKKIFNENKTLFILAIIIIISLIFMGVGLIRYFYGSNKDPYGDRLRDKDKYPISENIGRDIKALYESGVSSVNVDVRGGIVYVTIDVINGTSKLDAQSYAVKALEKFDEKTLGYYDIQFIITCDKEVVNEGEKAVYPIEGAKKRTSNQVVWTNN